MLAGVAWILVVAVYIVAVGARDQAAPSDAIIVLGAAAYDARPSPVFRQRILHGMDLQQRGLAHVIIFTGGYGQGARYSEAEVGRRYAIAHGHRRIRALWSPSPVAPATTSGSPRAS